MREICQLCGTLYGLRSPIGDDREVSNGYCAECVGIMNNECKKEAPPTPAKESKGLNE